MRPVPDGMVEVWQANTAGRYAHPGDTRDELPLEAGFSGFARSVSHFASAARRERTQSRCAS